MISLCLVPSSMSSSYPREQQVDVRQDWGLVEAEQTPLVKERGLPPSYSQCTAYPGPQSYQGYGQGGTYSAPPPTYNITQTPIPAVHPGKPQAGVVELGPDQEAVNRRVQTSCAIWSAVTAVVFLVVIIVVSAILSKN